MSGCSASSATAVVGRHSRIMKASSNSGAMIGSGPVSGGRNMAASICRFRAHAPDVARFLSIRNVRGYGGGYGASLLNDVNKHAPLAAQRNGYLVNWHRNSRLGILRF